VVAPCAVTLLGAVGAFNSRGSPMSPVEDRPSRSAHGGNFLCSQLGGLPGLSPSYLAELSVFSPSFGLNAGSGVICRLPEMNG